MHPKRFVFSENTRRFEQRKAEPWFACFKIVGCVNLSLHLEFQWPFCFPRGSRHTRRGHQPDFSSFVMHQTSFPYASCIGPIGNNALHIYLHVICEYNWLPLICLVHNHLMWSSPVLVPFSLWCSHSLTLNPLPPFHNHNHHVTQNQKCHQWYGQTHAELFLLHLI